jgi:quinol monooxygenase YgiN
MLIVHVFIQVKSGDVEKFIKATLANAKASIKEPGILRFDVLQDREDVHQFVLVEVYRTKDDPARHKETEHYKRWNETVEEMMAVPRYKKIYKSVYPGEDGWL